MNYLLMRLMTSFLSGVLLSQAGSFIQLGTRNILASPSTLGIDGLAILWVLLFYSLLSWLNLPPYVAHLIGIPLFVLLSAAYSSFMGKKNNSEKIILLGLTFNLVVGAIYSLWQFFFLAFNISFPSEIWFGHFKFPATESILSLAAAEIIILICVFIFGRQLKIYSLGETFIRNSKLRLKQVHLFLFAAAILATYVVVSLHGAFAFLALIFPICARHWWFKRLDLMGEIIAGSLMNGLLLMLIDYLCYRFPIAGAEIPVGLLATIVGAVSLILILWYSKRSLFAKSRN